MQRLGLLWLASLAIVAVLAPSFTRAQTPRPDAPILSGNDIGFRLEGTDRSGRPTGSLMVRVNGKWFEAGSTLRVHPLK
jgi:hypothetical protein